MSGEHAEFAPSFADTWINCYGAKPLIKDLIARGEIDPNETNEYMEEGTWAHEIAAECLRRKITPLDLINKKWKGKIIDVDDARALNIYYRICMDHMSIHNAIETRIHITDDVWGTADFFSYDPKTGELHVIDLKYGKGVIREVIDNYQEMIYAYGVVKKLEERGMVVKNIVLWIIQPRIHGNPVKNWNVSPEYLYKWASEIMFNAVIKQKAGDRTITPGPVQCRFCPASKNGCNRSNEVAHQFFEQFVLKEQDLRIIPIEKVIHVLENEELIKSGIKKMREYAENILLKGGEIPGYQLKNGRSNRQWTSIEEAERLLRPHVDEDVLYAKKFIGPAGVENVLGKKHPLMEHINKFITKPEGKPKLVKSNPDLKPVLSIQDHFQNFINTKGEN